MCVVDGVSIGSEKRSMLRIPLNSIIGYVPLLLGILFVYAALFRPPKEWYWRLIWGISGALLLSDGVYILAHHVRLP